MKPGLLYLVHRIPYPPNKGDKIRSFNLLRVLAKHFRIYLGTFVDDPLDRQYIEQAGAFCEQAHFAELRPRAARIKSLKGLLTGEALTLPYYSDRGLARWVERVVRKERLQGAVVFSSSMAQYVMQDKFGSLKRIVDCVDMDSDNWRQYAPTRPWPMSWVYAREAENLQDFEMRVIETFDAGLFVSRPEAALFNRLSPGFENKIGYAENGVDLDFFKPNAGLESPYASNEQPLVFVGAMDYWPNVDAVVWFVREMFPAVRKRVPDATFYIVGGNPGSTVNALAAENAVVVTGRVDDVRPYVAHAKVSVAPIRIARGVQNKVLESMAMGRPTVVTKAALEGIDAVPGRDLVLASDNAEFVRSVCDLLADPNAGDELGKAARAYAEKACDWDENLKRFVQLLQAIEPDQTLLEAVYD